ncbi:MAG: hypothetical protein AAGA97_04215 [Pseudomonadota bacterium]
MTEYSDHFNNRTVNEQFRKLEIDDYNHAVAGVNVGRMRKHIPKAATDTVTGKKETVADRVARTLQWLLMNDENYARAHKTAVVATNDAMDAAASALSNIKVALKQSAADVEDILNRAATLPDGRKVFRDGQGGVVDQDGNRIAQDIADGIIWRGDEPTYHEYRAEIDRADALRRAHDEVLGIEAELGGYQGELSDNQNPASQGRAEAIAEQSNALEERIGEIAAGIEQNRSDVFEVDQPVSPAELQSDNKFSTALPQIKIGD